MKPRSQIVALLIAVVLCAVVAGAFFVKRSGDDAQAAESAQRFASESPQVAQSQSPVALTVIGDDLSSPAQSGTPVPVWPTLVQRDLGARVVSLSTPGSGYTTRPLTNMYGGTFEARAAQAAPSSRVVLLVGGANDQRATRVQLLRAASAAISSAQQRAPDATVVVIGPPSPEADAPDTLLAVRDALREAASRGDAQFVDPISRGWLNDGTGYLSDDDRSLTTKGQQQMATLIEAVVRPLL